jgi:hypothetical protein
MTTQEMSEARPTATATCPVCGSVATGRETQPNAAGAFCTAQEMADLALNLHQTFTGHAS